MALLLKGFTDHTIDTGEVKIGYSVGPDNGPTLLLLHGATSRRDTFFKVTDSLTPEFRVIAMDQRGHGFSGHTPGYYLREDHARDIEFILKNVCKEPSIVWGHSMGGGNAIETIGRVPGMFRALIIEDSSVRPPGVGVPGNRPVALTFRKHLELLETGLSFEQMKERLADMSPGQGEYYPAWKAEGLMQMDIEIIQNALNGAPRGGSNPAEILQKIDVPFLYLQADPAVGGTNTDEILDEIIPKRDNFTVRKISGATHNINREHTEPLLAVVLPWLASVKQSL